MGHVAPVTCLLLLPQGRVIIYQQALDYMDQQCFLFKQFIPYTCLFASCLTSYQHEKSRLFTVGHSGLSYKIAPLCHHDNTNICPTNETRVLSLSFHL